MKNLELIINLLSKKQSEKVNKYFIPELWNTCDYDKFTIDNNKKAQIGINPYDFYLHNIIDGILNNKKKENSEDKRFSLYTSTIYSVFTRAFTAWDHNGNGIENGSFLKTLALLPYLKKMNVDIIYLLPIFEYSVCKYKKGELGSAYAVKDIYKLDRNLHDPLLGEYSEELLNIQFSAFVEACHLLDIKVMIDFVFRSVGRDNILIKEHPDWFYWIDKNKINSFIAPTVEDLEPQPANLENISLLYNAKGINDYLSIFSKSPDKIDKALWDKIISKQNDDFLEDIEEYFGITTAPAFSDVINDTQPAWTDITFLRYYFDITNDAVKKIVDLENYPPFVMHDSIKTSVFAGKLPNKELWEYIENVIPYYIDNFNIDGARIDMGHALPHEVNRKMISKIRNKKPSFILWAEEFNVLNSKNAKEQGYDFINGNICNVYKEYLDEDFNKLLFNDISNSVIPVSAGMETPDTPRAALRYANKEKYEFILFLNCLLPNSVLLLNNGFELLEIQPMNLGLDNTEEGRFVLDKHYPMYGKLAFFDKYALHWDNGVPHWIINALNICNSIREEFSDLFLTSKYFVYDNEEDNHLTTFFGFRDENTNKGVYFIGNRSNKSIKINLSNSFKNYSNEYEIKYTNNHSIIINGIVNGIIKLLPGEFIILTERQTLELNSHSNVDSSSLVKKTIKK